MLPSLRRLLVPVMGLALGFVLGACAQGEGDRCERDQDCKSPLRCVRPSGKPAGFCTSGSGIAVDAGGPPPDMGMTTPDVGAEAPPPPPPQVDAAADGGPG